MKYMVLFAGTIICLTGCNSNRQTGKNDKPVIMVTIEPLRYFTEAIVGDKFTVVSMVPKGMSPETYDPTPQQMVDLGNSIAYFRIGYIGFEQTWMERITDNVPHIQVFDMSEGVDLIYEAEYEHNGHVHIGGVEPHIWNSAINAQIIASNILFSLTTFDKDNEAYYMSRFDTLCHFIDRTDYMVRELLETENSDKAFMIYHPALSYYARDYGLRQISIEENGKEPSPAHMKELIDLCRKEEVHTIFVQPEFDTRNAEVIARQTNTRVVPINPLSYDWQEEMLQVARVLSHQE
ncbi:MAG: zinc ABC transporter substrate-binding protein [Bacteroides sp.]|nr:zinc ABC transporter substrate-binding protein [Bacteroides sp.]